MFMQIHLVPDFSPIKKGNLILYGKHGRFVGGGGRNYPQATSRKQTSHQTYKTEQGRRKVLKSGEEAVVIWWA